MDADCLFRKYWLSFLLCLLCACDAMQAVVAAEKKDDKKPSAIDISAKLVLYLEFEQPTSEVALIEGVKVECELYYRVPNRNEYRPKITRVVGTGFLLESQVLHYVVTAKHLAKSSRSGRYWISPVDGEIASGTFEEVQAKLPGARWFFHEYADIAVHPVLLPRGGKFKVMNKNTLSAEPPELLTQVCIPGFPHTLGKDNVKLGPLVTRSEVASWPAILPNNPLTKVIFLNDRLAQGYSGAPVYSFRPPPSYGPFTKYTMEIVGIQSGVYVFAGPGTGTLVTKDELSYIIPTSYLIDLLDSKDVQDFEKDLLTRIQQRKEKTQP